MSERSRTVKVIFAVLAVGAAAAIALLWQEGRALFNQEQGDLVSDVVSGHWKAFPFFAFLEGGVLGFVVGSLAAHFGWPLRSFQKDGKMLPFNDTKRT